MKSARVGVLSIIELKNARWNIEILWYVFSAVVLHRRHFVIELGQLQAFCHHKMSA